MRRLRLPPAARLPLPAALGPICRRTALPPLSRLLSTKAKPIPPGSAYDILSVSRDVDADTLKAVYKQLAREWHPDRHQGEAREKAEAKFQEISEAFQVLSDPVRKMGYDEQLDAATTAEEAKKAAQRFRAQSWNTPMPDVKERLKNAKREEAGFPPHIIAGTLLFVTGNFVMVLNWLGG